MKGLIYLEDGSLFKGYGFGAPATNVGELVFNTSMSGYQEILTDPSYSGQVITMTYPLIGNYGINSSDMESDKIHAMGFIAKDISFEPSNAASEMNIDDWLKQQGIPGVYGVDTRKITKRIRKEGTVKCVISNEDLSVSRLREICNSTPLRGDWMKEAGTSEYIHIPGDGYRVAIMDFGVKGNIIESFKKRNCDIHIFPYGTSAEEMMSVHPHGIFLTNGPGDPAEATEAVEEIRKFIGEIPVFGICMGHQVLALALGGSTYKLKYGHRGGNHGVFDKDTGKSYITSQNHGYAVNGDSLIFRGMEMTHINLNDMTVEGMRHRTLPVFSVQFHPEASPGPQDTAYLFDKFITMMGSETNAKE
ncbi:MAG: glutamine-hydrolyzing carbamoyl-phosphate synthase small subunit [Clostridiales bacterium]|nr:glutamine-hydrolyzing carbamoyl-phosphate synthase small subunit [Clostridiales bacterium]MDY5975923.1 glutamine-hydrolyzing carbamoyl-phosphate synthase small subunit [Anaerovoracaceae bacterium]